MTNVLSLTTPLMRQTVGFDSLNEMFDRLLSDASEGFDNYPPYNIEKIGEDDYRITMAVAGFTMEDLNIVLENGVLTVSGVNKDGGAKEGVQFLHRGIAARAFERTFRLADHIEVTGAEMRDGLLTVHLVRRVPEEMKPRAIPISAGGCTARKTIENKKSKS